MIAHFKSLLHLLSISFTRFCSFLRLPGQKQLPMVLYKKKLLWPATLLKGDCEYCEIFKNAYFEEHLQTTAMVRT